MGSGLFAKASALLGFAALSMSLTAPALAADQAPASTTTVAANGDNPFADVPANSWAYQAIEQLHADGLIQGYPDGYFKGNRPLTRYEIAVLTQRVSDKLEADLADASKAAKVNSDDIVLVRRLLDTYGADLAEVKQTLAKTQAQVDANTAQLKRTQLHVTYILRPGVYGDKSVIVNGAGAEVPNTTPRAAYGAQVGPGGQNSYTDGRSTHGTGYQIVRLGLTGQLDEHTSYNLRFSTTYLFDSATNPGFSSAPAANGQSIAGNSIAQNSLNLDYANIQYAFNPNFTLTAGRYIAKNSPIGLLWSDYFNGALLDYHRMGWTGQLGYSFNSASAQNVNGNAPAVTNFKPGQTFLAHVDYKFNKKFNLGANYVLDVNSNYGASAFANPVTLDTVAFKPQNSGSIYADLKLVKKLDLQGEVARHMGKDPISGASYIQPVSFWGKAFYGNTTAGVNHNYGEAGLIIAGVNGLSQHSETYGQGDDYQQFYLQNLDGYHVFYAGAHHYISDNARVGLVYQRSALNPGVNLLNPVSGFRVTKDQGQALFLETVLQF
jgi:hypothetical protein